MKGFSNDNVVILQQKLIHLGAEVKRLQADLQKVKNIDFMKKLEAENQAWQEERNQWKEKIEKLESANKKLEAKWKEEHKSYEAALEKKRKLKRELALIQEELTNYAATIQKLETESGNSTELEDIRIKLERENQQHLETIESCRYSIQDLVNKCNETEQQLEEVKNELTDTRNQLHFKQEELAETRLQLHSVQQELVKSEERLSKLSEENRNKNGMIADLESHLIQSNRKVMDSGKENEQLQEDMKTVVSLNESLERENVEFKKKVTQLEEDLKGVHEENSIMHKEMNKLRAFVGNLEKKANIFFPKHTVVAEWKEEKASTADKHSESAEPKIQSWFYNNVKKET